MDIRLKNGVEQVEKIAQSSHSRTHKWIENYNEVCEENRWGLGWVAAMVVLALLHIDQKTIYAHAIARWNL